MRRKDWTGTRQGWITVTGYAGHGRWTVRCDCGAVFETSAQSLRNGTRSCGMGCGMRKKGKNDENE